MKTVPNSHAKRLPACSHSESMIRAFPPEGHLFKQRNRVATNINRQKFAQGENSSHQIGQFGVTVSGIPLFAQSEDDNPTQRDLWRCVFIAQSNCYEF